MLVERYNHLGGLSTGGLVIWIDRMSDWTGKQVIAGIACDFLDRLPKDAVMGPSRSDWGSKDEATTAYWRQRAAAYKGIVTWSPTVDPEALKTLSMRMVLEQKVRLLFHSWVVEPIVGEGALRGAIFESKEGRQAIMAKVVIDTTGDADLLARAGLPCESDLDKEDIHHSINTAFLLGGVDMERWLAFRENNAKDFPTCLAQGRDTLVRSGTKARCGPMKSACRPRSHRTSPTSRFRMGRWSRWGSTVCSVPAAILPATRALTRSFAKCHNAG